ncbi:MAG: hypothetical protein U9O55_01530 [Patescibacteria group bacterium]|nr:hypothetical protein [Patescibacteria group bacterium]
MLLEDSNVRDKLLKNFIKYFNYFLLLLIVIFFLSCYFILLKPKQDKISEIENVEIFQGTKIYDENTEYFKKVKSFVKKYDSISDEDKKRIDLMLPDKLDYPQLFAQLESLIESNGFKLNRITLSRLSGQSNQADKDRKEVFDFIKKVNISITIDGVDSFSDYKRMLDMFYSNLLLMDITSINYSDSMSGSYSVDIITYFLETENSDNKN